MKTKRDRRAFDPSLLSLILPYSTVFFLFILIPVLVAVGLSFTYFNVVQPPRAVGFLNYITLLTQDEIFLKHVLPNTFKYAFIVGPGGALGSKSPPRANNEHANTNSTAKASMLTTTSVLLFLASTFLTLSKDGWHSSAHTVRAAVF